MNLSSIPVSADDIPDYEVYSLVQKVYNVLAICNRAGDESLYYFIDPQCQWRKGASVHINWCSGHAHRCRLQYTCVCHENGR